MRETYYAGDFSVEKLEKLPLTFFPLSQQPEVYGVKCEFTILRDNFARVPLNTPFDEDDNAILQEEGEQTDIGSGCVSYSRTYWRVPGSWDDSKVVAYTFPGFPGYPGTADVRNPPSEAVAGRIVNDYFVVDPDDVLGSGCTAGGGPAPAATLLDAKGNPVQCVFSPLEIPVIQVTKFYKLHGASVDYHDFTNMLTATGGIGIGALFYEQTLPTFATYKLWIENAELYKWDTLVWDGTTDGNGAGNGFAQLVAQDSSIELVVGNVYRRETIYVLAK